MMGSLLILFVVEMYLNAKTGGHSHGGPTGNVAESHVHHEIHRPSSIHKQFSLPGKLDTSNIDTRGNFGGNLDLRRIYEDAGTLDKESSMPAWFVVFYEQYVRQHTELVDMMHTQKPSLDTKDHSTTYTVEFAKDEEEGHVSEAEYRRMSANITLLEGGILFHSIFVGMTVSITIDGFIILLVAILFHQMFEGLGLGSRIAAVPFPHGSAKPWLLVFAFGTTAPIGQAIGLLTRNTYDPNSEFGLIIVGLFNAM